MSSTNLRHSLLCLSLGLVTSSLALNQTQANALAQYALTRLPLGGGVVSLPRCASGELAVAFVQNSRLMVHAMAALDADVAASRSLAEASGALGRRVYVEKGAAPALPYADNFIDLLVIADLTDATLTSVSGAEVQRVLRPGGLALVGRAATEGAGLTQAAVQTWLGSLASAAAETNAQGVWAVISKPRPAGSDDWTHHWRAPDNNPRSLDANAGWPYLPQWRGKPYNAGRNGTVVASGGRLYSFIVDKFSWDLLRTLRAFRTANGQPLWTRNMEDFGVPHDLDPRVLAAGMGHFYYPNAGNNSYLIADQQGVYVCGTTRVYYLNGETGATARTVSLGGDSAAIWLAKSGDTLYALIASGGYFSDEGRRIAAHDATTGAFLWQHVESAPIHKADLGMSGGRIYFYARSSRVACISAAGGGQVWENRDAALVSALEGSGAPHLSATGPTFLCSPQGIYISRTTNAQLFALSADDGHQLWSPLSRGSDFTFWAKNDTLMFCRYPWNGVEINVRSGASTNSRANLGDGCGPFTLSPRAMFTQNGGLTYSFAAGFSLGSLGRKSDCLVPPVIENGIWVTPNTACSCYPLVRGMFADAPAGSFVFDQTATDAERLEQGPVYGSAGNVVIPDGQDWPTHRADNPHSARSTATLSSSPHLRWQYQAPCRYTDSAAAADPLHWGTWSPYAEHEPTPPVVVGDRVFWAGSDGFVRCHNSTSNTQEWRFATGGRVYATPSVASGCVYVGSADGYAYCIEAHTGQLVWRFRGAPAQRRMNLFGHLASTWPILTGVLVQGGTAYFAAGFTPESGVHVYAVNATTGRIVWQNNQAGLPQAQRTGTTPGRYLAGLMPGGYMTIVGSRLWVRSYLNTNAVFDLATGALQAVPSQLAGGMDIYLTVRGRDMGALDATHAVFGGRPLFADRNERGALSQRLAMRFMRAEADGDAMHPQMQCTEQSLAAPAWDGTRVYASLLESTAPLACWNQSTLVSAIDAASGSALAQPFFVSSSAPSQVWGRSDVYPDAVAVGANAVAAVYTKSMPADTRADTQNWYVGILSAASGATAWEAALPSQPVYGGLALSCAGDIVVTLVNGDVVCYGEAPVSVCLTPLPPSPAGEGGSTRVSASQPSLLPSSGPAAAQAPHAPAAATLLPADTAGAQAERVLRAVPVRLARGAEPPLPLYVAAHPQSPYVRTDTRWQPEQPCLAVAAVSASSSTRGNGPAKTIDRDLTSRWVPLADGQQAITYDLGSCRGVSSVSVVWYAVRTGRTAFCIEVSTDGKRFGKVDEGVLSGRGTQTTLRTFVATEARFVRVALQSPLSLYEVGVHAAANERQASLR